MQGKPYRFTAPLSRWVMAGLATFVFGQAQAQRWEFSIPRVDGSWSGPLVQTNYATARLQLQKLCDANLATRSGRPLPTVVQVATFAPLAPPNTQPDSIQEVPCTDVQVKPGLVQQMFPKPARQRPATAPAINLWD